MCLEESSAEAAWSWNESRSWMGSWSTEEWTACNRWTDEEVVAQTDEAHGSGKLELDADGSKRLPKKSLEKSMSEFLSGCIRFNFLSNSILLPPVRGGEKGRYAIFDCIHRMLVCSWAKFSLNFLWNRTD